MNTDWKEQALCAQEKYRERDRRGKLLYNWDVEDPRHAAYQRAKKVCEKCPVQKQCLEYALEAREPDCMWGGVDADQRARMVGRDRVRTFTPYVLPSERPIFFR